MRKFVMSLYMMLGLSTYVNADGGSDIYISVYQPDRAEITSEASKYLEGKMRNLITKYGIMDEDEANRFVITAKLNVISKDIVPSTPQRISEKIEFTFIIGDIIENKVFETISLNVTGIDINEDKAYISAINKININDNRFKIFLENAKNKIVSYYSDKCAEIIMQAQKDASDRNFDAAIYKLIQIPPICDCAEECQKLQISLYTQRTNLNAAQLLTKAKSLWASSPTPEGASAAADVIARIPSGTLSQAGIDELINDIESKLKDDQRKEWNFKIKQYNDEIAREKRHDAMKSRQQIADNEYRAKQQVSDNEYRAKQQASDNAYRAKKQIADIDARNRYIDACRQVGLEYAKNQPQTVIYRKNVYYW